MGNTSGAQNNETFRQNISINQTKEQQNSSKNKFNSQGIFNEYYFDTGLIETKEIFETNYNFAKIENPITKKEEIFVGFGLNCKDDGKNIRNSLNLIILLDISGSMNSMIPLTDAQKFEYQQKNKITKLNLAKDVLINLFQSLKKEDNFGIILFNNKTTIFQELQNYSKINSEQLVENIDKLNAFSGTDMELALQEAQNMLTSFKAINQDSYRNNDTRIIFITDAQPNCGNEKEQLINVTKQFALEKIFITYIGIGLDFNVELTEQLTKIRGCNFFGVHSGSQCKSILIENFNYLMTPQVFDAEIEFESQDYEIEESYGTNFCDENSKQFFKMGTIMAGNKINNQIKGGIILAKLRKKQKIIEINDANQVDNLFLINQFQDKFILTYEIAETQEIIKKSENFHLSKLFSDLTFNSYTNQGIRKAVLLAIYSDFLKINLTNLAKVRIKCFSIFLQLNLEELILLIKYIESESQVMNTKDTLKEIEILQRLQEQLNKQKK